MEIVWAETLKKNDWVLDIFDIYFSTMKNQNIGKASTNFFETAAELKNIVLATDYSIHGKNFKTEDVEHAKFYYVLPLRYAWNYVWQRYKFGSGFNINEYYPYYSKSLKFGDISGLLGSLLARGTLSYMEWRKAENLYYLNDGRYENPNPRRGRFK